MGVKRSLLAMAIHCMMILQVMSLHLKVYSVLINYSTSIEKPEAIALEKLIQFFKGAVFWFR
jgi:hypothetical protein